MKLDQINENKINAWTQKHTPEFLDFIQGREVGGYTMRPQTKPVHQSYNTHPKRSIPALSYENLDETEDETSKIDEKRSKKRSKPVPKDGPSIDHLATHRFYLRSRDLHQSGQPSIPDTTGTSSSAEPQKAQNVLTVQDSTEQIVPVLSKGKLVVTTHVVTTHTA